MSGEPNCGNQIDAYFFAEALLRIGKIMPFKINHQIKRGISTTRGSERNSFKYDLTAFAVGAAGVPKFNKSTAVLEARKWGF
jgi:hypothetical protein